MVKNLTAMQGTGSNPWVRKIPWRREWQPTPVFLPGKLRGQRSLVGYSPWRCEELEVTEHTHRYSSESDWSGCVCRKGHLT